MREGWTYKRWSDILTIINGKNQSAVESVDGKYPIYGSGGIMGYANDWLCPENCVVIGRKGNINKPIFVTKKFWNVDTAFGLNAIKDYLLPKFLFYFCQDYNFERHNKAVTIPSLTKADLQKVQMPLPSLSIQQSIVAELDKINELIGLKKSQLSDLDSLAQSIFYDMFGDPVENEKGWEVKRLGDLCEISSAKRVFIEEVVDSGVPFIRGTELTALSKLARGEKMDYSLFITQEHYERLKAITGVPKVGDLLIPSINSEGIVWMVDTEEPLYFKDGRVLWVHVNKDAFTSEALLKIMSVLIKNIFSSMNGATFAELKLFVLRDLLVPLPPLPLQQSFASRITAIEQQKQRISSSIKDLETLLASRMQYWFD